MDAEGAGVECVWNGGGAERTAPLGTADGCSATETCSLLPKCYSGLLLFLECCCVASLLVCTLQLNQMSRWQSWLSPGKSGEL